MMMVVIVMIPIRDDDYNAAAAAAANDDDDDNDVIINVTIITGDSDGYDGNDDDVLNDYCLRFVCVVAAAAVVISQPFVFCLVYSTVLHNSFCLEDY